jgi:hypothetical protein
MAKKQAARCKKFIIHDKWMCERFIGIEVPSNKKDYRAFKIGKCTKLFHVEQITIEPFIPFPKNVKTKTIYELHMYPSCIICSSIAECISKVKQQFKLSPVSDVKQFLKNIEIQPKIVFDV